MLKGSYTLHVFFLVREILDTLLEIGKGECVNGCHVNKYIYKYLLLPEIVITLYNNTILM